MAKKIVPSVVAPVVVPVVPATVPNVTLVRSTAPRKGSAIVYVVPGLRAVVKIARSAFVGEPPASLVVVGSPFATAIAKMTKEERAARRAAMTPADIAKAARERADRAVARAKKLEAAAGI